MRGRRSSTGLRKAGPVPGAKLSLEWRNGRDQQGLNSFNIVRLKTH